MSLIVGLGLLFWLCEFSRSTSFTQYSNIVDYTEFGRHCSYMLSFTRTLCKDRSAKKTYNRAVLGKTLWKNYFGKDDQGELLWEGHLGRATLNVWSMGTVMQDLLYEATKLLDYSNELLCRATMLEVTLWP